MHKTIFFDLDGTLTPESTWFLLNQRLGITPEEDRALFEKYLHEKLAYTEWMDALMELYKRGALLSKHELIAFAETIPLRPEAKGVIDSVKERGYIVVLISGSLDTIVSTVAQKLGIAIWYAKTSAIFDGEDRFVDVVTHGDGERDEKFRILQEYCTQNNLNIQEVICVEDGGNGLELFKHAKGVLLGANEELKPFAWKQIENLSEITELI